MKKTWIILIGCILVILSACNSTNETNSNQSNNEENVTEEVQAEESSETAEDEEVITENTEEQLGAIEETSSEGTNEVNTAKTPVELIFSDDQAMDMYRVERQIESSDEELFKKTIEAWVAGPTEEGLVSLIPEDVVVQSVEDKSGTAFISFSSELLNAQVGSGTEGMILQQIAMIMKQFGFSETQILIDGEIHDQLFGHYDTNVPIVPHSMDDYEKFQ